MKVERMLILTQDLIKVLQLPEDTSILNVIRNPYTLDIELTIQSSECQENCSHGQIANTFYQIPQKPGDKPNA